MFYHLVSTKTDLYKNKLYMNLKKYGLMSPQAIYDILGPDEFMKYSGKIYYERTQRFLKKHNLTADDILNYLNSDKRYPFNSSSIFFLYDEHHVEYGIKKLNATFKIIIDDSYFKYNKFDPIFVMGSKKRKINWNEFYEIKQMSKKTIVKKSKLIFANIPHVAFNCYLIKFKNFNIESV